MYEGTFKESFTTQYGHGLVVNTDKGEWKVFGKGTAPAFSPGTPIQFEAQKKGNSWAYSNLVPMAGAAPVQPAYAPQPHAAAPAPVPTAQPIPTGAATAVNPHKEKDMFVTGVVGRAMSSGQFTVSDMKILALAADDAWDALEAKRAGRFQPGTAPAPYPQAGNRQAQDGPDPHDPRFQNH